MPAAVLAEVVREPMFLLLLAAGAIYLSAGRRGRSGDAGLRRRHRGCHGLSGTAHVPGAGGAARSRQPPRLVIRDGEPRRIASRDVVAGDLLLVAEGDRVAADGVLVECHDLVVDESMLSGESKKVPAQNPRRQPRPPVGCMREPGSCRRGAACGWGATGAASAFGTHRRNPARCRRGGFAVTGPVPCAGRPFRLARAGVERVAGGGARRLRGSHWLQAVLAGITLAMSALPRNFRSSSRYFSPSAPGAFPPGSVLTRRQEAIETLGAVTMLCVDKTGTLTENRMRIARLGGPSGPWRCRPATAGRCRNASTG